MFRRFLPALVLIPLAFHGAASAAQKDDVAPAFAQAKKDFTAALKSAELAFNNGTNAAVKSLAKGTTRPSASATYQGVVVTFATSMAKAANDATKAIEAAATSAMTAAPDDSLQGALQGDGGSVDQLAEFVELNLENARRYAATRMKKFTAAFAKGSNHARMNIVLPPWPYERHAAPALNAALTPLDAGNVVGGIVLWAAIATRLDDGTVTVAFAGTAPKNYDGNFGIYLVAGSDVKAIGKLSAGGIPVTDDRTWTLTATLNNPALGEAVNPGNRFVQYGIDPIDQGPPAGRQPTRFMLGGVVGVE